VGCHTRKILTSDVEEAVALGADGVAVHVNITSLYEHEMLALLGRVNKECSRFGMPLFAIMYPRREADGRDDNYEELRRSQPEAYAKLVRHAVRVGVELGADLIKTQYTGSLDTFTTVIASACGVPVFIAGGPLVDSSIALRQAVDAVAAGAAGVSFGRNVFNRSSSTAMLKTLRMVIDGAPLESAMASNSLED
jgi:DhnA family fructose-bisphosphate aldolase class Ia